MTGRQEPYQIARDLISAVFATERRRVDFPNRRADAEKFPAAAGFSAPVDL